MGRSSLIKGLMSAVKASAAPLLIILGFGVTGAILGHVLGYVVAGVSGVALLILGPYKDLRHSGSSGGSFLGDLKLMLGYGFPLYISTLLFMVIEYYRLILLPHFVSNFEIENFRAAVNLTVPLTVLLAPIATALFPAFSKLDPIAERSELRRSFKLSIKYASLIIIPASLALMLLSEEVTRLIYGPGYELAAAFLSLYVVLYLFTGLGYQILESFFNGVGETKLTLMACSVNAGILIPLALPLTQLYGVPGLISASLASSLASVLYGLWLARKRFGASPSFGDQARVYLTSALSALPLFLFLRHSPFGDLLNLVLGACVFVAAYLTLAPLARAIRERDPAGPQACVFQGQGDLASSQVDSGLRV